MRYGIIKTTVCLVFLAVILSVRPAQAFVSIEATSATRSLAHYAMGYVLDLLGETEDAAFHYEQAAQFDEKSYLIRLRLGTAYARLGWFSKAIDELNMVKVYNPDDLQSHYLLALIYSSKKDYAKAAEEYEFILKSFSELEPENVEIYGYLGQLYYSQKKYDQAIEQFEKILQIESKNADVMYLLGSLYLEIERKDKAVDLFKESIVIDPEHDGSLNSLGYVYAQDDIHLDEALDLIKRSLKVDPDNGAYLDSLGWVYYKKKMYDQALEALQKADAVLKDPIIYEHMGDVYSQLNDIPSAIKYWELSLKLSPDQEHVIKKLNSIKNSQASNSSQKF